MMAARWDIAGVIAPIVLGVIVMLATFSPTGLVFIRRCSLWLLSLVWPSIGRCNRVLWSDIQDGQVSNQMPVLLSHDTTATAHKARKPYQLPALGHFLKTDLQTLKAFLILGSDICRSCEKLDLATSLEIKEFEGVATVHLKRSGPGLTATKLSKFEVEKIIEGYPPFYRLMVTTTGSIQVAYPLHWENADQMKRGAWVLAAGMTINEVPSLHNMQLVSEVRSGCYWRGTNVMRAFVMIGFVLRELRKFEESLQHAHRHARKGQNRLEECDVSWTDHALACYDLILSPEYSEQDWVLKLRQLEDLPLFERLIGECPCNFRCGYPHSSTCGRNLLRARAPAKALSAKQCKAAFEIFNNYQHSTQNLETIKPVLYEILVTTILGMSEVENYFAHKGRKLDVPEALRDKRYIYVRRCNDEEYE